LRVSMTANMFNAKIHMEINNGKKI